MQASNDRDIFSARQLRTGFGLIDGWRILLPPQNVLVQADIGSLGSMGLQMVLGGPAWRAGRPTDAAWPCLTPPIGQS